MLWLMGKSFLISQLRVIWEHNGNIRKIATDQRDDYTTGCLLDCLYFKENYKLIAIDLSKQQALDADPKEMQQLISQEIKL